MTKDQFNFYLDEIFDDNDLLFGAFLKNEFNTKNLPSEDENSFYTIDYSREEVLYTDSKLNYDYKRLQLEKENNEYFAKANGLKMNKVSNSNIKSSEKLYKKDGLRIIN